MDVIRVMSGITKPLRAYVEPSRVCLYGLFLFVMHFVFIMFQIYVGSCFLSIRLRTSFFKPERFDESPYILLKARRCIERSGRLQLPAIL